MGSAMNDAHPSDAANRRQLRVHISNDQNSFTRHTRSRPTELDRHRRTSAAIICAFCVASLSAASLPPRSPCFASLILSAARWPMMVIRFGTPPSLT